MSCRRSSVAGRSRAYRVRDEDSGRWLRFTVIAANHAGRATASSIPTRVR